MDPEGIVPRELRQHLVVFLVRPTRGRPFASVAWPGFVGLVTALNADGLSLACLTSTVSRETANATPLLLLYRTIAQYAGTLDEVEWLLRGARRTIGNNLMAVSGPANDARGFELTMERVRAIRSRDGVVVATNHFQHPAMAELQVGWVVPLPRIGWLASASCSGRGATAWRRPRPRWRTSARRWALGRLGLPEQSRHDLQLDRASRPA